MSLYYYLIFESIHKVMKAEQLLKSAGIRHEIIPTPKEYSSDCGMSIRLSKVNADLDKIREILDTHKILFKAFE